jgi:hypothetical protein
VGVNVAQVESANCDRPLSDLLGRIDFEAIADHWLARFDGYRRRELGGGFVKSTVSASSINLGQSRPRITIFPNQKP